MINSIPQKVRPKTTEVRVPQQVVVNPNPQENESKQRQTTKKSTYTNR